jgi:hypothetical protein
MSAPTSPATIEFPAAMIDEEIRKHLENEQYVRFKPQMFGSGPLEIEGSDRDGDVEIDKGIFHLHDSEARYGEFYDLEELLIQKGIPLDRASYMDWNRPPELRVFRPGEPPFDHYFPLDHEAYEPVVSVVKIRELLALPMPTHEIQAYLEKEFPAYPPLTDWVKKETTS